LPIEGADVVGREDALLVVQLAFPPVRVILVQNWNGKVDDGDGVIVVTRIE
jgi:hypothetical protein